MILLANGCSHTSGAELDENNTDYCYEKAWPKYLADYLGLKNINLSRSGASNDRIVRTTYSWISKYLSAGKNPEDLFVVIMWTGIHRTEIATDDNDDLLYFHDGWFPLIVGNDEEYKLRLDKPTYLFYKSWVLRNTTRYTHTKFYMNILGIQSFLKSLGIKYLFWNTTITLIDTSPDLREQLLKNNINYIDRVLYTHQHGDQTHGINDLRVFYLKKHKKVPLYADKQTTKYLKDNFSYCFKYNSTKPKSLDYPATLKLNALKKTHNFSNIEIQSIRVNHGNIDSICYIINNKCAYASDVKFFYKNTIKNKKRTSLLGFNPLRLHRLVL